jgi:CheY-like chemotaxis protein
MLCDTALRTNKRVVLDTTDSHRVVRDTFVRINSAPARPYNASHPPGTPVEDEGNMMLRELLRECGYRVLEAASTDEAIAVLEKTAIPVDVVLSEIDIAGSMNGVGFAQWARSIREARGLETAFL